WSFLHLTHYEDKGAVIELSEYNAAHYTTYLRDKAIAVPDGTQRVYLKAEVRKQSYSYLYSFDGTNYERIPVTLDAAVLSDDYVKQNYEGFFTGAMVGLACVDMTGFYKEAVFTDFLYSELGDDYTECK
ncbi:MAG: glycoside hydrolase 43 family protein, partial [Lachnospiraceae bacterium]|nr:glycoside hydrolase 43 family protein [Lachnospiraceae bacterium]